MCEKMLFVAFMNEILKNPVYDIYNIIRTPRVSFSWNCCYEGRAGQSIPISHSELFSHLRCGNGSQT